jgi:hypothetical protein
MTKQTQWAVGVVAFVVTAVVARRIGQYEVIDQIEKQVQLAEPARQAGPSDSMFSSLSDPQPLHDCILHGDNYACRVVANKLRAR